jgi:hypothetical protein
MDSRVATGYVLAVSVIYIYILEILHLGAAFFGGQVRDRGSNPRWPQRAHAPYHQATALSSELFLYHCHTSLLCLVTLVYCLLASALVDIVKTEQFVHLQGANILCTCRLL